MPALSSSRAAFVLLIFCIMILSVEAAQCLGRYYLCLLTNSSSRSAMVQPIWRFSTRR